MALSEATIPFVIAKMMCTRDLNKAAVKLMYIQLPVTVVTVATVPPLKNFMQSISSISLPTRRARRPRG